MFTDELSKQQQLGMARFRGPLPGCPIPERHAVCRCRFCRNLHSKRRASLLPRQEFGPKQRARNLVHFRIKRGKMTRLPCEICGAAKTQAHHEDYSKPSDVRWLCPSHHAMLHHGLLILEQPKDATPATPATPDGARGTSLSVGELRERGYRDWLKQNRSEL